MSPRYCESILLMTSRRTRRYQLCELRAWCLPNVLHSFRANLTIDDTVHREFERTSLSDSRLDSDIPAKAAADLLANWESNSITSWVETRTHFTVWAIERLKDWHTIWFGYTDALIFHSDFNRGFLFFIFTFQIDQNNYSDDALVLELSGVWE